MSMCAVVEGDCCWAADLNPTMCICQSEEFEALLGFFFFQYKISRTSWDNCMEIISSFVLLSSRYADMKIKFYLFNGYLN